LLCDTGLQPGKTEALFWVALDNELHTGSTQMANTVKENYRVIIHD